MAPVAYDSDIEELQAAERALAPQSLEAALRLEQDRAVLRVAEHAREMERRQADEDAKEAAHRRQIEGMQIDAQLRRKDRRQKHQHHMETAALACPWALKAMAIISGTALVGYGHILEGCALIASAAGLGLGELLKLGSKP